MNNLVTKLRSYVKNARRKFKDKKQLLKMLVIFSSTLVFGLHLGDFLFKKTVISVSPSLPHTVFRTVEKKDPELGDYVNFKVSPEDRFAGNQTLIKQISCLGGQHFLVVIKESRDYYCCYENVTLSGFKELNLSRCTYLGKAKTTSQRGDKVEPYYPCAGSEVKITTNETSYNVCIYNLLNETYFVSGTHKDSYDSRYFGPIKREAIISILKPIF